MKMKHRNRLPRCLRLRPIVVLALLVSAGLLVNAARADASGELQVVPSSVHLSDAYDKAQLLVSRASGGKIVEDLTHQVRYESLDSSVVSVDKSGVIRPVGDGKATVRVIDGEQESAVDVVVEGIASQSPIRFNRDVMPILSKAGCNGGACHGAQYGQAGFKLSLFGYEPAKDHEALVRDRRGRRVVFIEPEQSLMLRKPTLTIPHGGGRRLDVGSDAYRLLCGWIAQGAPGPRDDDAAVTDLSVLPAGRILRPEETQQLQVIASYSDGSKRDVTATAKFDTLNDGVAAVGELGLITANGSGQTAVMVRYEGQAKVSMVVVPFSESPAPFEFTANNFIDDLVAAKWRELGLVPAELSTDAEFLRRAYLDSIGTLPKPETVREFVASTNSNKRGEVIDELLGLTGDPERDRFTNEFSAYWALKWGDLLRNNRNEVGEQGMWAMYNWLRDALRAGEPLDQFTRELITAQGSIYSNGPANYFRIASSPPDLAETTAQVFLGVRLQCARCHHHPFENYSQADYYGMAAFFARVGTKGSQDFGLFGREQVVRVLPSGEVKHPRTGQVMTPTPLEAEPIDDPIDRRRALARWLTSPENDAFARNFANRFWGYLMGVGLVEPIDDMRATNPPTNQDLLDALADYLVEHHYDMRQLLRVIMNSRVYQLSCRATEANAKDRRFYTHYYVKRLGAEVLLDAIDFVTGEPEKFTNIPLGTRAIELPDPNYSSYFLDTLGRPQRVITCECERTTEPNLAQALHIANGELVNRKISAKDGRLAKLLESTDDNAKLIDELYLLTLSRPPRQAEIEACTALLADAPSRKEGAEDLLWALVNSKDFLFVH